MNTSARPKKILRAKEARARLACGKTKFAEDFLPRLRRVKLSARAYGVIEEDVDKLIDELTEATK